MPLHQQDREGSNHQDDEVSGALRLAVQACREQPIPQDVLLRATERAAAIESESLDAESHPAATPNADFAHRRSESVPSTRSSKWDRVRRSIHRGWRFAAAASLVLAATVSVLLSNRSQLALAAVADAMLGQTWIHVLERSPAGELELWLSPKHAIKAVRAGTRVELFDHRLHIVHSYSSDNGVLYRLPFTDAPKPSRFEIFADSIPELLRTAASGAQVTRERLAKLEFLAEDRDKAELLDVTQHVIKDDGRNWLEFSLRLRHRELADPIRMTIRVDPQNHLPRQWKTEGNVDGRELTCVADFDYPPRGPIDVYALGVPETAQLVDRVPADDLARLLEGVQASRERFDSYQGILVRSAASQAWYLGQPIKIWRKGNRWRLENPVVYPDTSKQPHDNDAPGWWRARAAEVPFYPLMVCDGTTVYQVQVKFNEADDPAQRTYSIVSVKPQRQSTKNDAIPVIWSLMPEYASRPPLGIPRPDMEPIVEANPSEGPPGCVLLRVRRTPRGPVRTDGTSLADAYRYWIDPSQGYVVRRWEMEGSDAKSDITVEELARSPQGHWYPTTIRLKNAIRHEDGALEDELIHWHLDFDADLPDSLFAEPR